MPDRNGPKLPCPHCHRYTSRVIPAYPRGATVDDAYRRVRECAHCHTQFTSLERVERIVRRGQATA